MENEAVEVIQIPEQFSYNFADLYNIEDEQNRVMLLNCEIDDSVVENAVYHILRYNRADKGIPLEERRPIRIYINSRGGEYTPGYSLIDAICMSKTPVFTINVGRAASMAFNVFIAGHKRYSMPNAWFLIHDGEICSFDSAEKFFDRVNFFGVTQRNDKKYIVGHTGIDEELYDAKRREEWYLLPGDAKSLGIVDYIIGEDCDIDEIV